MANVKISELTSLSGDSLHDDDLLAIVDDSASLTKQISLAELDKRYLGLPQTENRTAITNDELSSSDLFPLIDLSASGLNKIKKISISELDKRYVPQSLAYKALVFADSPYTISATSSDRVYGVTTTAGAVTINLPAASTMAGKTLHFVKLTSDGNAVTLDGNSSEKINGENTQVISSQYSTLSIYCTGTEWIIL